MAGLRLLSAWPSVRWKAAGLMLATLLLLAAAMLFEREVSQSIRAAIERTALARAPAGAALHVLSAVQDAETGQRGFLLTGRAYYLEPYQQAAARVALVLDRLGELGKDTPWLREESAPLRELVPRMMAELGRTV